MMQCQHHTKNSNRLVCTYICLVASPSPSATDAYLRLRRRFHVHASGGAAPPMMSGTMSLRRWSSARSFTAAAVSVMVSSSTFNLCASSRSRESDSVRTASVNLKTCRPEESTPLTKQQTSEHRHFVMSVASCTEDCGGGIGKSSAFCFQMASVSQKSVYFYFESNGTRKFRTNNCFYFFCPPTIS